MERRRQTGILGGIMRWEEADKSTVIAPAGARPADGRIGKPNLITMFKQGTTRLPLEKVPAFATSLDVDQAELMRLWLATYEPEALAVIDQVLGTLIMPHEKQWLSGIRLAYGNDVPDFDDEAWRLVKLLAMARGYKPPASWM
jgi:hypothetical protein